MKTEYLSPEIEILEIGVIGTDIFDVSTGENETTFVPFEF